MKNIYQYSDYKAYVSDQLDWGGRSKLARFLQVQAAFISQVLKGASHFSLEQADRINEFLKHGPEDADHFILMIQTERAGTSSLKKYFQRKLEANHKAQTQLRKKVKVEENLSLNDQATYYSHWAYAAIHVLVVIPGMRTQSAIENYLKLSRTRSTEILRFLIRTQLVARKGDLLAPGKSRLHVGPDSPLLQKHQQNWRLRAIEQIGEGKNHQSLHFSGVLSLSKSDAQVILENLRSEIEANMKVVHASSPVETLYAINIDFFEPV